MEKGYLNLKNILFKFRIFIYCFIGVIFGSCLGAYIDYVRHPELYVSSPWYSPVLYRGKIGLIGVGIVAVISIYLYISSRVKKSYREEKEKMKK